MQRREAEELPIIGQFNVQRFKQFGCEDAANFYVVKGNDTKKPFAMYPALGRRHVTYLGKNKLIFPAEPRAIFRSIDYWYAVVGNAIFKIDSLYNQVEISGGEFLTTSGNVFFSYLVAGNIVFSCFVDGLAVYVYREDTGSFQKVTDANAPANPTYIATFGNRLVVSDKNSSEFTLSAVNLGGSGFDPATCFTISGNKVFAQESGIIRQFGVLNNTLYIFTDFTTGIWANIPAFLSGSAVSFPFKKNTTYEWNFGIADPLSLDINFGRMTFLAQNQNGLLQVMSSSGGEPERISNKGVDVLFQRYANISGGNNPFLEGDANGFLYQYENTIFYRLSAGTYKDFGILDIQTSANSIEYNFETQTWSRCIELNGERNRIQRHIFFDNKHLVTVQDENTVYEMSGAFYTNELRNPLVEDDQASDAYIAYPLRYERITPIISEMDYSEFETEYVEIDFVWGESNISYSLQAFENAVYLVDETSSSEDPVYLVSEDDPPAFLITEEGSYPQINEPIYNQLYKPHVELYWSDDGGISFQSADVLEFSQMGYYQWRMRWYQLGCSRNRAYKLVAVSPVPIVVLGGVMLRRRVSGGGN